VCDVYTFAWNQFLYYTQMSADPNNGNQVTPQFLHMAPWYNALTVGPKPGAYPGGATDLRTAFLDQAQAGTDGHLLDTANQTVRYDIRFDVNMYESIVLQNLYTAPLFTAACQPDPNNNGTCKNNLKLWVTPSGANEHPEPGSIEIKTSWRDFGTPASCPASQFYCNGRFGLVGLHYINKTFSHGEWIWASFEHVANAPDCAPGGDSTIAPQSPIGTNWSFFNPATAGPGVLRTPTEQMRATRVGPAMTDRNNTFHARKCKAGLAVVNGFIFAVDFPLIFQCLFARGVGNGGKRSRTRLPGRARARRLFLSSPQLRRHGIIGAVGDHRHGGGEQEAEQRQRNPEARLGEHAEIPTHDGGTAAPKRRFRWAAARDRYRKSPVRYYVQD